MSRSGDIHNYSKSKTKRDMQKFMKLSNCDRVFVMKLPYKIKLIYNILSIGTRKLIWDVKTYKISDEVKKLWSRTLKLKKSGFLLRYQLKTSFSNTVIVRVFKQKSKIIAYILKVLKKEKRNYSIAEKKCKAPKHAVKKLKCYLVKKEFVPTAA
ncbi:hypothetical protein CDIK_3884 [Cucumispora dikerogammari]|nr:hypothetical protein CDIK_3884 [Cucumispora dikerogammari]